MIRLTNEPSLNPPEDKRAIAISETVDELSLDDLASDIKSYGLEDKIKAIILKTEFDDETQRRYAENWVYACDLEKIFGFASDKTISESRDYLTDYLVNCED